MSWINRWKPKHVVIDSQHPSALGICDDSDFAFNRKDLVKQMEWRGNRLQWTGFYKGRPFLDTPQQQFRPPAVKADPYPVKDPRLPQPDSDDYPPYGLPVLPPQELTARLNALNWTAPVPRPINAGDPDGHPAPPPQELMDMLNVLPWSAS